MPTHARDPGAGERAVVGGTGFDQALRMAGSELLQFLESFLLIAYDIQAAISAPAPGSAPITVPSTLPRSVCRQYLRIIPPMPFQHAADLLLMTIRPTARSATATADAR